MEERYKLALDIANRATQMIRDTLNQPKEQKDVQLKQDGTPVTSSDISIARYVQEIVEARFPDDGFSSEEIPQPIDFCQTTWLCDPIDGTTEFIEGNKGCSFVLSLLHNNVMEFAIVGMPDEKDLFSAMRGKGAFWGSKKLSVSNSALHDGVIPFGSDEDPLLRQRLLEAGARVIKVRGSAYKCLMVAKGEAVAFIKTDPVIYDIAPSTLIVSEAGGCITDFYGAPVKWSEEPRNIILSNAVVDKKLIEIVNQH